MMTKSLLLLSFCLFGAGFLWQSYNYSIGEIKNDLEEDANKISELTTLLVENNNSVMRRMYSSSLTVVVKETKADIYISNLYGQVVFISDNEGMRNVANLNISSVAMDKVINTGKFSEIGNFYGIYNSVRYTCGVPVISSTDTVIGAVFVSAPPAAALGMLNDLRRMMLITSGFVLFLAFVVSYFMAQNMSRPLKNMSKAARAYGRGDFSIHLDEDRDDEIGELAHSLNHMSASLERLEELRSSFIANVSHELKTPMTTIAGFADGILDGTIPPELHNEYLEIISNDTKRLSRLVVRMLEASRIESGQMKINPTRFDLCDLVLRTVFSFEQKINVKHIDVNLDFADEILYVVADADSIVQVVSNLVDNACKFTPENGQISISIIKEGTKAVTSISNTGNTISEENLQLIFDRFYKIDKSRAIDKNGAGLGLFIVKSVLSMHGEDISVSSSNGLTQFRFTLPVVE
ncbi:MAG: HAMP domain-containing histidine kinase [Clostridiales bacterium]|nr:HAMP domain-containing histidine kinase [Clostridiales bacterium]